MFAVNPLLFYIDERIEERRVLPIESTLKKLNVLVSVTTFK